ncbi:protein TRIGALACTOSYLDIACYLGLYCEROL 2, chloroplastic-like isoform X2 [Musa acuminata AAA Group]|uniref:protein TRIGALACTOSYLDIACYLGLYCEROL 2, chloroplastic-like isoform X2 n=1 Tax=Musa acuminata AAA Group TaxID=214697 RepID=UPI0031D710BC
MFASANSVLPPPFLPSACSSLSSSHALKRFLRVKAASVGSGSDANQSPLTSSAKGKNPLAAVLELPRSLWWHTMQPLGDFGFGRTSVWEGAVGLFMVSGAVLFALAIAWLRGVQLRSRLRKYQVVFQFSQACGICVGTPVRIRGVNVGSVVRVDSTVRSIDAVAESGLLMETLIDITPRDPLPESSVGPLNADCVKEGLIVCDKEKIRGQQGVSLDALVGVFTRLGQEMDEIGISRSYRLAEKVASVVEEAQPLLAKIEALAEGVQPLLAEVRDSTLLKDVENLTKSLAEATVDLRTVRSAILTPENAELTRQSIFTLIFTLKNIESITSDISGFTGDVAARRNLKMLIKSLSRLL